MHPTLYEIYKDARSWINERREQYRAECKAWAKQGFRPQYCIHGTNLWVEYDPICGYCEADELPDTVQAYIMAKNHYERMSK